jgi:hypothetical protein
MLQLNNQTPFKCALGLFPNEDGVDCAYGVAKATFEIGPGSVTLGKEQLAVVVADEPWGEPGASSLKRAAELGLAKPFTDVLLHGHAYAPNGGATSVEARLRVGSIDKTVRVFGDRVWDKGLFGLRISQPQPFQKIPLKYELAFGGTDRQPGNPDKLDYEPRNPVGRGLVPKKSQAPAKGAPLPNLEDPSALIRGPKERPAPACFAPVSPQWQPRKALAGTYDEAWMKRRAPYLPKDFDRRFHQVAPADLVSPAYLKGGELVDLSGVSPNGPLRFQLPNVMLEMIFHFDGRPWVQTPNLDTVCFEPDERRFSLLWRACVVVDKKVHRLRELQVRCRDFSLRRGAN